LDGDVEATGKESQSEDEERGSKHRSRCDSETTTGNESFLNAL
jgi:hypothetical protein